MLLTQQLGGPQDRALAWVLGQPTEVPSPMGRGPAPSEIRAQLSALSEEALGGDGDTAHTVGTWESNGIIST